MNEQTARIISKLAREVDAVKALANPSPHLSEEDFEKLFEYLQGGKR